MELSEKRAKIHELLENHEDLVVMTAHAYAEPGYDDPEAGIIVTANWNDDKAEIPGADIGEDEDETYSLSDAIEALGGSIEWSDEWTMCDGCQKLVRTSPDSYSWRRSYFENNEMLTCHECVDEDPEEYIEYLKGNERTCMTMDVDLEEHGFVKLEDRFERGLHPCQAADPQRIAKALRAQGISDFIFELDDARQFDVTFSVWVPKDREDTTFDGHKTDSDVSPAIRAQQGLPEASRQLASLQGEGVRYANINVDTGEVETLVINRDEFGKK